MTGSAAVPPIEDERWRDALEDVVDDPSLLVMYAQPILELSSGQVAGYELLSRFAAPFDAPPDRWFAAAERWGRNAVLQGRVVAAGIAMRAELPPDTFLTVNVDPHLLTRPEVASVLTGAPELSRLVLEVTEHSQLVDDEVAYAILKHVRGVGGLLAMDDAGTGYAGLSKLLTLRPDIVKLDRELITGIDRDPVKRALVEVFGDLAGQMDAWILAEGIETRAELEVIIGLGVPLGQGYALGRAAPVMVPSAPAEVVDYIRATAARTSLTGHVASIVREASVGTDPADCDVVLDADGRAAMVRTAEGWAPAMTVAPSAAIADVARRAMAREHRNRFAPLVCTDGTGAVLGLVRIDDLVIALSSTKRT